MVDAAQFFDTFPTKEEFAHNLQLRMPTSNLSVRCSFLSMNAHVPAVDTPFKWIPRPQYQPCMPTVLGTTREELCNGRDSGASTSGGGGNGGATGRLQRDGGRDGGAALQLTWGPTPPGANNDGKRKEVDMLHCNTNMHAVLQSTMARFYHNKIEWRLVTLCKAAGLEDMRLLPRTNNFCFQWLLGSCEPKPGANSYLILSIST